MINTMGEQRAEVPLSRRRGLVAVVGAGIGVYLAAGLAGRPILAVVGLVAMAVAHLKLRQAIQTMADRPDEQLDERQVSVRDRAYLSSYRLIGGAVALLVLATVGWDLFDVTEVSTRTVQTIAGALLFTMVVVPTAVVGWSEREV